MPFFPEWEFCRIVDLFEALMSKEINILLLSPDPHFFSIHYSSPEGDHERTILSFTSCYSKEDH